MANESIIQAFDRFTAHVTELLEDMRIENSEKYATKEFALENGGKIDKILVNTNEQIIGTDKSVNLDLSEYATKSYVDDNTSIWVAGSDGNEGLYYSLDGKEWKQSNITNDGFRNGIYYDNGIWVAGSYNSNGLYYSLNGIEWMQSNITSGKFRNGLYYANGIWVAGSYESNKGLYYSTDGKEWVESNITNGIFDAVYYANGVWVAAGSINTSYYYSLDGKTWVESNIKNGSLNKLYYANGIWVAGSYESNKGLYYSTDGKEWVESNIPSDTFYDVYYANGIWVTSSNNGLYYSTDGKTWTESNITSGRFASVYYGNNIWVTGSNDDNGLYYSTDGINWNQSNITNDIFKNVYYANGLWIAPSNENSKGLYYSTDGKTWTESNITSGNFYGVYHGGINKLKKISVNNEEMIPDENGMVNISVPEPTVSDSTNNIYITGVDKSDNKVKYSNGVYINPYTGELFANNINANKVYGAVWNDYAEWFEKQNIEDKFEPGDICAWDTNGVVRANSNNLWKIVGVCSDSYGHILGGEDLEDMEANLNKFVPIGLAGRVKVKVLGKVNIGDYIVSSGVDGIGVVDNTANLKFVVGQALEYKDSEKVDRITILIK